MKKILAFTLAVVLIAALFVSCQKSDDETQYNFIKVSAAEAKEAIDKGEYDVILDVRKQEEYDAGHIAGCVLVTIDKDDVAAFKEDVVKVLTDKDAKILVYCKAGFRSDIAAKALSTLGYNNVFEMTDGMDGWTYDVEK